MMFSVNELYSQLAELDADRSDESARRTRPLT